mgnify:CR=1 FL=1
MKLNKFVFIEALICDARWYDVNGVQDASDEDRLKCVEELYKRVISYSNNTRIKDKVSMIEYINETIYSETFGV